MTERPEGAPGASPDEPESPPTAETETVAPEASAAVTEELVEQTGAFEPETDDAAADEIEDELEAEEATEEELAEEEFEEEDAVAVGVGAGPGTGSAAGGAVAGGAVAGGAGSAVSRRRGAGAPAIQRAPTQSELAVRVTDNASRFFVLGTVVIFAAIILFGLLAGTGGLLSATPAPPTAVPSVSADPSASASAGASASPEASPS